MRTSIWAASCLMIIAGIISVPRAHAQDKCSDVLRDGVLKKAHYVKNFYDQWSLAVAIAEKTKGQAEKDLGISGSAIIKGIPVGANYTESDFNSWASEVKKSSEYSGVSSHYAETSLFSGDSVIVGAWENCMQNSKPLKVHLQQFSDTKANIYVQWQPIGVTLRLEIVGNPTIEGAELTDPSDDFFHKKGSLPAGQQRVIPLTLHKGEDVRIEANTNSDPISLFLPYLSKPPPQPPQNLPVVFEGPDLMIDKVNHLNIDACLSTYQGAKCPGKKAAEVFCKGKGFAGLAEAPENVGSTYWTVRIDDAATQCKSGNGDCGTYKKIVCTKGKVISAD